MKAVLCVFMLKKHILFISLLFFSSNILFPQNPFAPSRQSIINSFEKIVKQVDILFTNSPVVLVNNTSINISPTDEQFYLLKFNKQQILHNVDIKDNSQPPYRAHIELMVGVQSNAHHGNIKKHGWDYCWGFDTAEDALNIRTFGHCCDNYLKDPNYLKDGVDYCIGLILLVYYYENDRWLFKWTEDVTYDRFKLKDDDSRQELRKQIANNSDWAKYINPNK